MKNLFAALHKVTVSHESRARAVCVKSQTYNESAIVTHMLVPLKPKLLQLELNIRLSSW